MHEHQEEDFCLVATPKLSLVQMTGCSGEDGQTDISSSYAWGTWSHHATYFGTAPSPWRYGPRRLSGRVVRHEPGSWRGKKRSPDIVSTIINNTTPGQRKGIKSLTILILWEIWQERNLCTFRGKIASANEIITAIRRCVELWRQAGATCIETTFGEPLSPSTI